MIARLVFVALLAAGRLASAGEFPLPAGDLLAWRPPVYPCRFTLDPPVIDGRLEDAAWQGAAWTRDFVDIEGDARPTPPLRTRARPSWKSPRNSTLPVRSTKTRSPLRSM
jgi:hypothetical protein